MQSRSVRVGLTTLTLLLPLLIVAAAEPGLAWWSRSGFVSIGLAECTLVVGMLLAVLTGRQLATRATSRPPRPAGDSAAATAATSSPAIAS